MVLVLCPVDTGAKSLELGQDGVGGGGPDERFAGLVVVVPSRSATALLGAPAAQAKTMVARRTSAAGSDRDRAIDCNCACSASLNTSSAFGRPIAIEASPTRRTPRWLQHLCQKLKGHHTSTNCRTCVCHPPTLTLPRKGGGKPSPSDLIPLPLDGGGPFPLLPVTLGLDPRVHV